MVLCGSHWRPVVKCFSADNAACYETFVLKSLNVRDCLGRALFFAEPFSFNSQSMLVAEHPNVQGDARHMQTQCISKWMQRMAKPGACVACLSTVGGPQCDAAELLSACEEVRGLFTIHDATRLRPRDPNGTRRVLTHFLEEAI